MKNHRTSGIQCGDFDMEKHIEINRRSMSKIQCFIPWTLQVNWIVNQSGYELNDLIRSDPGPKQRIRGANRECRS